MMKLLKVKDGNVFTDKISKTLLIAGRGSKIQKYVRLNIVCLKSKYTQTHFYVWALSQKDIQMTVNYLRNKNQYLGRKDSHSVFYFLL